ncbi:MAG: hypothetical protein L6425_03795 [Candidatus Aminicenantes bacterium]|nr:hypothetical protein [Candidatus Aminicenantes bacterium]
MSDKLKSENRLTSWKEIATFLDCDVRTCHRYEKDYRLPVHRISGKSRSRVYAYKEELEQWMQERSQNSRDFRVKRGKKSKVRLIPALAVVAASIAVVLFLLISSGSDTEPFDFRIERSELIVLDKNGRELWRFDTGFEDLIDEQSYRSRFQFKKEPLEHELRYRLLPLLIMKDINKDGHIEILFAPSRINEGGGSSIYCLDKKGNTLWEFPMGRPIRYDKEIFMDFTITGVGLFDLNDDGFLETVFHSHATNRFPSRICVVDHAGQMVGEYWNSGMFSDFTAVDLNGDGIKELLIGAQNNGYKKACLIVLDPYNMNGGSPQLGDAYTTSPELERGTEKYYILFPNTDVELIKFPFTGIGIIRRPQSDQIKIESTINIIFVMNHQFECLSVVLGHFFRKHHDEMKRQGQISSDYTDPAYTQKILGGILYFNGTAFVSTPTMSNPWGN